MSAPEPKLITIRMNVNTTKSNKTNTPTTTIPELEPCDHREQVLIINQLFLETAHPHPQHTLYKSLLLKKYAGYKQQDIANTIYDPNWFITFDELLELLVSSKLTCYYCRKACFVHYSEPLCQDQWTLERLSNDHGHNRTNVVVACLKCNLHRGTKSSEKFKLGKQLRFIKM
jgi:hypothetical protein